MNLRPIIALAALGIAYAVGQQSNETPVQVVPDTTRVAAPAESELKAVSAGAFETSPVPNLTMTRSPDASSVKAGASGVLTPTEHGSFDTPAVTMVEASPAAGGFCANGNCGPAASRRVYQVERPQPQRRGLFGGRFRRR